ncbi:MAG: hypothetical protein HYU88_04445 [Chloroflexi bacterium]|nr:hypothetical protein [Chloroflexota bacterium]
MRLRSLHPGVAPAEVAERTGFALAPPNAVPTTPPPTADELAALRAIDTTGLLRQGGG